MNLSRTFVPSRSLLSYGPDGIGLLVVKGIPNILQLRQNLLSLAGKYDQFSCTPYSLVRFANLPEGIKEKVTHAPSNYSVGWSHGKEILSPGVYGSQLPLHECSVTRGCRHLQGFLLCEPQLRCTNGGCCADRRVSRELLAEHLAHGAQWCSAGLAHSLERIGGLPGLRDRFQGTWTDHG
jgi:hypothetical protein